MMRKNPIGLFEATGIELEYMIVDRFTLNIRPICDQLLKDPSGLTVSELARGATRWSNELAMHLVETKTNGPTASLESYRRHFGNDVTALNQLLAEYHAMLLPTGMHPWMNPREESVLWPHEQGEIYQRFDKIFSCNGHGWTNLQSMHINLPFADAREFEQLHRAIRFLLPLMPALSASSPFVEGEQNGIACNRLRFYESNCRRVPLITARVVPEDVATPEDYREDVLLPMYRQLGKLDPEGILKHEWLNARGAIARFDRGAIEIRVLDTQECPAADLLIAGLIRETLINLVNGVWSDLDRTATWPTEELADLYDAVVVKAEHAVIRNQNFLDFFHYPDSRATVTELWLHLLETGTYSEPKAYEQLVTRGSLSSRIRSRYKVRKPAREALAETYRELADCLAENRFFVGAPVRESLLVGAGG
ncbi:carboxylate-amine ligase [Acanthopleuribacter pedis]|uniref:Glutamate--cysteine ligase n=1 Tax=Acanthopleuribacter pedis TaxID=442870 RepID=A0A8J7QKU0_9BACT|nr:glutamate-cysteine ligase family protein [Acanthopleuribacter pedis]MBO1322901.1 hypothetical protein [Acanthopleuribacter pedis]